MKVRAYVLAGTLGLACLGFNVLAIGAAAERFPAVAAQARAESPLAQTYIVLGRYLTDWVPALQTPASALAEASFDNAFAAVEANPSVALDALLTNAQGFFGGLARACYWGAPILLFAFVLLFWFRPRTVHLIRSAPR